MNQQVSTRIQHCLREVSALVKLGDWRNACETLAIENRRNPDQYLERALIDILLQASDTAGTVETAKPGDSPLPFKGSSVCGVIPEVSAAELTADKLRDAIQNHGYLLVRNMVSGAASADLRNTIDKTMRARMEVAVPGAADLSNGPYFYESPHFPGNHIGFAAQNKQQKFALTGSIMVPDSPRGAFQVLELFRELNLKTLLAAYFGEPAVIASRKWVFRVVPPREVGDGVGGGWHQDGQFMGAGVRALNMWIALTPCGDSTPAPGLALIPRRIETILEYGTGGANIGWVVGRELVEELAREAPLVRPYFAAGDALFFDHLSLHRSGHAKNQDQNRYALESWFYAASGNAGNYVIPIY